ncbi:hypothetical protein [Longispora albida]|uniref:hypothetical protein n=1 Tax=Longispora albida TaxID=203523 RepID=UPI000361C9FA|nr:hypothetical protein [Longispora albida]
MGRITPPPTLAHSELGIVSREAPVLRADTCLTEGGLGLRALVPVIGGQIAGRAEAQLAAVGRVLGEPVPEIGPLFDDYCSQAGTALVELVTYRTAWLAIAGPLTIEPGTPRQPRPQGHPLECALRRTTSQLRFPQQPAVVTLVSSGELLIKADDCPVCHPEPLFGLFEAAGLPIAIIGQETATTAPVAAWAIGHEGVRTDAIGHPISRRLAALIGR